MGFNSSDLVVLVDEQDNPIGEMEKGKVHSGKTPLHRGLSVWLFDDKGRVLVQRRALGKKTWPGVWSNSCCSHPRPGESYEKAALRGVKEELGLGVEGLKKVTDYRYRFERDGIVENEICPVFAGKATGKVKLDPKEVWDYKWMGWEELRRELKKDKVGKWSEWCKEEFKLVAQYGAI